MTRLATLLLLFLGLSGCNSKTPQEEMKTMDPTERQALIDLLKGTGLSLEALRPIGILGIDRNPKAVALDGSHIVGIRLSGVPVPDMSPLKRLPALQALWLNECGLTSSDGIANLPQLNELNLDGNKLTNLGGLKDLPALRKVSVRNNQIAEMPDLGPKVKLTLDGNPVLAAQAEKAKAEEQKAIAAKSAPVLAADAPPAGMVPKLPKIKGKTTGKGPHHYRGVLLGNPPFESDGIYDSLVGAFTMAVVEVENADSTVDAEISVEKGRVRLYLEDPSRKGYCYAEATPGKPARLHGRLIYGIHMFEAVIESVDEVATGIRYRFARASR